MSSPGGSARASGPDPGTAGADSSADEPADGPVDGSPDAPADVATGTSGEALRPVPDPPAPETSAAPEEPEPEAGPSPDADPTPDADGDSWTGSGPDTGTVRRSRPSRSGRSTPGVPTPPSPMTATPVTATPTTATATAAAPVTAAVGATPGPATGATPAPGTSSTPVAMTDPPRRPVPPTFSSPGQPPPGVARRHGRHARPEVGAVHTPPSGYRPRHAAPDAETEQFAAVPYTGPGGVGPAPLSRPSSDDETGDPHEPVPMAARTTAVNASATTDNTPISDADMALWTGPGVVVPPLPSETDGAGDRVRVVLAERRVPTRAVRTVAEIEQQTETGELLLRNLLRAQLALGLRLGLVAVFVLGALPVLFLVVPRVGAVEIAGVTLPWLVLGFLPYPFMLALAWLYIRTAERNELDFADNVED
ncbi:hypothetical protein [Actinomycetospora callitridis]|uniref:hypothetical protein n=1 Tax=Actinomycetospora callitridis TaxID=913944 RepID=UPI0023667074|nr:hypothetical protein [Actinomycetospora callitridis]MDD7920497.1 hypothetical protein [Actinomycetospora callitridis]